MFGPSIFWSREEMNKDGIGEFCKPPLLLLLLFVSCFCSSEVRFQTLPLSSSLNSIGPVGQYTKKCFGGREHPFTLKFRWSSVSVPSISPDVLDNRIGTRTYCGRRRSVLSGPRVERCTRAGRVRGGTVSRLEDGSKTCVRGVLL